MATNSDCEQDDPELTHPIIVKVENATTSSMIPETSKKKYEAAYKLFMDWREDNKKTTFSENVLTVYFSDLSKKYNSATLWTQYSMLRTTLTISHNVDIAHYAKLRAFLKQNSAGYVAKKAKTFTSEEINKFISEAPDQQYLLMKTALIMGAMGDCRKHELNQMKVTHLSDLGSAVLVKVPDIKTKRIRTFTVTDNFYDIIKKYWDLRPRNTKDPSFFLTYHNGKCTSYKIGFNKLAAMGKQIATYLKLPNPELFTGRFFRRSSTSVMVNPGEAGWESTTVTRSYIDSSLKNDSHIGKKIQASIESPSNVPPTANDNTCPSQEIFLDQMPSKMIFNNCTISFNIIKNNAPNKN